MSENGVKNQQLVQIGKNSLSNGNGLNGADSANGMSRRNFLKVLSAAPVAGAVACSDSTKHKAFPNVKGEDNRVPGTSVWYNSTCQECSAGCGITVRTREGRALKVEGNRQHPINKGGLCALGQASLQGLYDPDRVRQPLKKKTDANGKITHVPISWDEALKSLEAALKFAGEDFLFVSGEQSGSLQTLSKDFVKALGGTRVVYDPLEPVEVANASKLLYGSYGVPHYNFEKADLVVNFGADFLETWDSPVEYARGWADGRRSSHPTQVIHIEPRLSLTGANADKWFSPKVGSEGMLALFLLKILIQKGKGKNLSDSVLSGLKSLVKDVTLASAAAATGMEEGDILLIAAKLNEAKHSLLLSGGASGRTKNGQSLAVLVGLLNLVLGNVGDTVDISRMKKPESDRGALAEGLKNLKEGKVKLVLAANNVNPAFSLPSDYGFEYALKDGRVKLLEAVSEAGASAPSDLPLLVSFSGYLDETAKQADLILPSHHFLEDWGDAAVLPGIHSLIQPVMNPVFDTKSFGEMLIKIASSLGAKLSNADGAATYRDYIMAQWKELHSEAKTSKGFEGWWREKLEFGGEFTKPSSSKRARVSVDRSLFKQLSSSLADGTLGAMKTKGEELILYPYFSVKSFDGRAANRPWLQELPDPIVQAVWDAWGEVHPDTAKKLGVKQGDAITVRNDYGELNVPIYVTPHVQRGLVAVPVGQGHSEFGRYAREVKHVGNVYNMLPSIDTAQSDLPLVTTSAAITRSFTKTDLVITQGSDSQHGRHLAQTTVKSPMHSDDHHADDHHGDDHHGDDHGGGHHGGHHHEPKQMYEQRVHPLYEWTMTIDLAACTGCSACVTACFAENNIPVVGKEIVHQGREMSWLRIDRYYDQGDGHGGGDSEELQVSFMPMMCQQCNNAPCEPVCPVYATYHNEEGLNVMVYNRCVGTRYCGNNCSYKVRRFNWFEFEWPEPMNLQLNPDVTKRAAGVMEKCTFCIQRIQDAKDTSKDQGRPILDGEVQPACVQSCPTEALAFGNINDPDSKVSKLSKDKRAYKVLDHHLNTQPSVVYLENVKYKV